MGMFMNPLKWIYKSLCIESNLYFQSQYNLELVEGDKIPSRGKFDP